MASRRLWPCTSTKENSHKRASVLILSKATFGPLIMATDLDSAGQERNARKREEPMEKDNVSAQEIKTEDVYRKCCSCHMMKAWIHGRGRQRCVECMSLQMRISRIQVSDRAVRGWYTVRKKRKSSVHGAGGRVEER